MACTDARFTLIALSASLFGCTATPVPDEPTTVAIDVEDEGHASSLRKRFASDALEGLALVWTDEELYPTAAAAKRAAPKRRDDVEGAVLATVHILEDLGEVVKVRTWLSPRVRSGMSPITDYDLTLYARRAQLMPVLRENVEKNFDDGTGYLFMEGMPVRLGSNIEPRTPLGGDVPFVIPPSAVGLSFPLRESGSDAEDTRGALVCRRVRASNDSGEDAGERTTEVVTQKDVDEERRAKARAALAKRRRERSGGALWGDVGGLGFAGGYTRSGCGLIDGTEPTAKNHAITIGGERYASAQSLAGDGCDGASVFPRRTKVDGKVIFEVIEGRAVIRLLAHQHSLRAPGGCGGGASASLGGFGRGSGRRSAPPRPPPKTVLAAVDKQKVWFPDGGFAGYHMGGVTRMTDAVKRGGRHCIAHPNVTTRICFDTQALSRVPK